MWDSSLCRSKRNLISQFPISNFRTYFSQIKKDDRLSTMLCADCIDQLIQIAKFRILLIESNEFLLNRLSAVNENSDKLIEAEYIDEELEKSDCAEEHEGDVEIGENVVLLEIEGATFDVHPSITKDVDEPQNLEAIEDTPIDHRESSDDVKPCAEGDQLDLICRICGKGFQSAKSRRIHEYVHNLGQFKCDLCPRILTTAGFLRIHMQNVHNVFTSKANASNGLPEPTETSKGQCDICKMYFPFDRIGRHVRTHAKPSRRRPKCPRCPQTFSCLKNLQRHHKKQHDGDNADAQRTNDFHCAVCSETFHRPIELYEHSKDHDIDCIETEDGYNLTCDDCSTPHTNYETYARHMIDVHRVKRVQPYKCRICMIRNGSKTGLYMHINCHYNGSVAAAAAVAAAGGTVNSGGSSDKPFPCAYCPLRLKNARRLEEHTRVHTGNFEGASPHPLTTINHNSCLIFCRRTTIRVPRVRQTIQNAHDFGQTREISTHGRSRSPVLGVRQRFRNQISAERAHAAPHRRTAILVRILW